MSASNSLDAAGGDHGTPSLTALLVPIQSVRRDPNQPRRDWRHDNSEQRLVELTNSVKEFGILQPLLVHDAGDHYVVIAGGRRLVAAQRAGMTEIPVVVRDAEGARRRILQLLENLQRVDLSPVDEGRAYQELTDLEGLTPARIALQVRRSEQHVRDRLRLIADQILSDAVARRQIPASVAREILKLEPLEYAAELRRRVEAGEKLQMDDIAEARTRMRQDGVVNPRQARGVSIEELLSKHGIDPAGAAPQTTERPHEKTVPPDAASLNEQVPAWMDPAQRRTVRSDKEAFARIQEDYERYRATAPAHPPTVAAVRPVAPAVQAEPALPTQAAPPTPPAAADRDPAAALQALLDEGDRAWLARVLTLGAENGWTCAGLLQQVRVAP